jgi:hypothetical protein
MGADLLGLNYSVVAQMAEVTVAGGLAQLESVDISRVIVEIDQ